MSSYRPPRRARAGGFGPPESPACKAEIAAARLQPGMYDAVVGGAGPAGGMAARPLAAAGFRTAILEKKKVVGEPVQCAEGVSEFGLASNGLHPRDEWVAQRVSGAKCIVPNGTWFYITRLPGYAISQIGRAHV